MLREQGAFSRFFHLFKGLDPFNYNHLGPLDLLVLQPTPFCNLACDYCYLTEEAKANTSKMPHEILRTTLRKVKQSKLLNAKTPLTIVWHAGEPMVAGLSWYKKAYEIIHEELDEVFEGSINTSFQTNGTLINQDWCDFIKKENIAVGVSVDGPEELNDINRKTRTGKGTFAKAEKGMKLLEENGIEFHIISVLTSKSIDKANLLYDFMKSKNVKQACFNVEESEGVNQVSSLNSESSFKQVKDFFSTYYDLSQKDKKNCREIDSVKKALVHWKPGAAKFIPYNQENWPFKILNVAYNGSFSTFSPELLGQKNAEFNDYILGNVLYDNFEDCTKTDVYRRMTSDIRKGVKLCKKNCQYFDLCGGGAPSNKIHENGSFASTETNFCKLHKQVPIEIVFEKFGKPIKKH